MNCVLLGDRHHGLSEGIRGLLETTFTAVFMVADAVSLIEGAARLQPKLVVVDVCYGAAVPTPVTLAAIKADPLFADMALVRQPRLSVAPVSDEQWQRIAQLAGLTS